MEAGWALQGSFSGLDLFSCKHLVCWVLVISYSNYSLKQDVEHPRGVVRPYGKLPKKFISCSFFLIFFGSWSSYLIILCQLESIQMCQGNKLPVSSRGPPIMLTPFLSDMKQRGYQTFSGRDRLMGSVENYSSMFTTVESYMQVLKRPGKEITTIEIGRSVKQRVHGFSLTECFPGKQQSLCSSCCALPL